MARRLALTLLSLAAISLACAGPAEEPVEEPPVDDGSAVALSEPWASMSLPVSDGMVLYSDPEGIMISHTSTFQVTSDSYANALRSGGYTVSGDYSEPNFTALAFQKGASNVGLMVSGDATGALVLLEDLGRVPEKDSNLAGARRGERKMPSRSTATARQKSKRPSHTAGGGGKGSGKTSGGTLTGSGSGGGRNGNNNNNNNNNSSGGSLGK